MMIKNINIAAAGIKTATDFGKGIIMLVSVDPSLYRMDDLQHCQLSC